MRLSTITEGVDQDLDHAVRFAVAHGVKDVAVRSVWGSNIAQLNESAVDQVAAALNRYGLRVSRSCLRS